MFKYGVQHQQTAGSFNHLVGGNKQRCRNSQAERLCCFQVDDELKLCRLHYGYIGRFLTSENSPSVNTHLAIPIDEVVSVAHETAHIGEFSQWIGYRLFMAGRQRHELLATAIVKR